MPTGCSPSPTGGEESRVLGSASDMSLRGPGEPVPRATGPDAVPNLSYAPIAGAPQA